MMQGDVMVSTHMQGSDLILESLQFTLSGFIEHNQLVL